VSETACHRPRSAVAVGVGVVCAALAAVPAHAFSSPERAAAALPDGVSLTLVVDRGAKVAIRRAPASRTLAVAGWRTPFGSVRRLRVVARRGDWFAVESDVLGNGVVGWVPRTAPIRARWVTYSVEADLSERLLTLREDGRILFRRRISIGSGATPTPSGRFHVSDQISGERWGLGCCIVVLSGTQPRLPAGWDGGDRLAVHGRTSASELIGSPASAGCLHATEQTLRDLARLPLGTPVVIHP
jgi:hypothetical protein